MGRRDNISKEVALRLNGKLHKHHLLFLGSFLVVDSLGIVSSISPPYNEYASMSSLAIPPYQSTVAKRVLLVTKVGNHGEEIQSLR